MRARADICWKIANRKGRSDVEAFWASSSLLKNLEMKSFGILGGRCWGDAAELDVIFEPGVGCTLTRGG